MKKLILTLMLVGLAAGLSAQSFTVPDYKFKTEKDYARYENDVVACVDWLTTTPVIRSTSHKMALKFLFDWVLGTPSVSVVIDEKICPMDMQRIELFLLFGGGYAKKAIEHKAATGASDEENYAWSSSLEGEVECCLAGLDAAIQVYTNNRDIIPENKLMESHIKMKQKGTLEKYIRDTIAKRK